ncbi:unnamed protein product [Kuraishia capsulata CBS 1993]|uniref:GPI-anchored wall transfer protein n=1 Tax=Kuraishia capsulata CBS 1993 TaxID=1382522 RepID=W6MKW2_9ASCO|nr:uncharacterized protein KUCA_T00002672001 [Kuraishia capsulata CBS 1993]CDK26698.1 unnamed protein product [Kuraishia capsulata CBS 1993]
MDLKGKKEEFVSGLTGGSTLEIYTVTSVSLVCYVAWSILKKKTSLFDTQSFAALLVDYFLSWFGLLLSVTLYCNRTSFLVALILGPVIPLIFKRSKPQVKKQVHINVSTLTKKQYLPYKPYLTVYRSQMMVITCIAILAVDFPVFPRRFAKVETWGTSLMDLGVGSFVFSMGMVSERPVLVQKFNTISGSGLRPVSAVKSYISYVGRSIFAVIPLIILGGIRLLSVKSLEYQEHVTEYGKHWNFFITLAALPVLSALASPLLKLVPTLLLSIAFSVVYEVFLVKYGWLSYVLSAERIDLISDNKEGIFSMFGYFSIFLTGQSTGTFLLPLFPTPGNLFGASSKDDILRNYRSHKKSWTMVTPLKGLLILSVFFHTAYYVVDKCYVYGVSRRLANLLYVLWVSAYNTSFLAGYNLVETLLWGDGSKSFKLYFDEKDEATRLEETSKKNTSKEYDLQTPTLLHAVNNNSLVTFLVANLLTGLVNMTYNTIDAKDLAAVGVLTGYTLALVVFTYSLWSLRIVLR